MGDLLAPWCCWFAVGCAPCQACHHHAMQCAIYPITPVLRSAGGI